jgi:DNA-binding NarL/FixJ family response regulator
MTVRILIVDDNPLIRKGLRQLLASHEGLEVVGEAADGVEALALLALVQADIMLLDLSMPRLDGFGVMQRLQTQRGSPRVLAMSAVYDDAASRRAILKLGATAYLSKGTLVKELIPAIENAAAI